MNINADYTVPVTVNGFSCKNCTEVDLAKRHVDPSHPKSGAFDRDAARDVTRADTDPAKVAAIKQVSLEPGNAYNMIG